ncbi:hypothetical protein SMACR_09637 [Sordaria macrospora]|uniref:WGS project CABT00000000 data, contig 2.113 n=2 Tax=Sordaria macrospora TaxID=5147 RepID=F7WCC4_SORMK|nr:uncharacterized protein SMAC_09637 [Sordaria macrospora k-hell]KAA8623924.1 hypothetical protein SMACR_09637 [Sordaria macrospora]WPJ64094.1 hypothetical protein SMAC4_09637 [Sordaria macrospora]CCC05591.1 unnamed protein product [Sordaria macrospora k-hell]
MADILSFNVPLVASNSEAASYKVHNEPGEVHRPYITGTDQDGATIVQGHLVHTIHGFHSACFPSSARALVSTLDANDQFSRIDELATGRGSNLTPCTLIVMRWDMIPGRASRRFRSVQIDLIFSAYGPRRGVAPGASMSHLDPVPKKLAPATPPVRGQLIPTKVVKKTGFSGGPTIGYEPFVSVSGEYSRDREVEALYDTSCWISGRPRHVGRGTGGANAVRFTFVENEALGTGVQKTVFTAVLLQREERDADGQFAMKVKVNSKVDWFQDKKTKIRDAVGLTERDHPVIFDPTVSYVVEEGERVERRDAKSGVDWRRLWHADLGRFLEQNEGNATH